MSKSYDVYMCRCNKRAETERQLADAELLRSSDELWAFWANKVARDGFLTCDADGKLVRKKEPKMQPTNDYPPYSSPFDRMPSKIEMQGMMEIFKREYGGGSFDEK